MSQQTQEELKKLAEQWTIEQETMQKQIITQDQFDWKWLPRNQMPFGETAGWLRYIAGVDISFEKDTDEAVASLVIVQYPELNIVYKTFKKMTMQIPYIAGFLGFREVDAFEQLFSELKADPKHKHLYPQLVMLDGNGILHYRKFGSACHLGLKLDIPCIGVAKNLLYVDGLTRQKIKEWTQKHLLKAGDSYPLVGDSGFTWGTILRPTDEVIRPVFVSAGHRISLETATKIVYETCLFRIPEPIREADLLSRKYIRTGGEDEDA